MNVPCKWDAMMRRREASPRDIDGVDVVGGVGGMGLSLCCSQACLQSGLVDSSVRMGF